MFLRLLFASIIVLSPSGCGAAELASAAMRSWDQVLPDDRFSDIAAFDRTVHQEGKDRVYMYAVEADDGSPLMSVVVAIGPAGERLDADTWKTAVSAASDVEKARDFPAIGARAQAQAPFFSPEGAMSGIAFTTSDELFDVLVSVFEASSAAPRGPLTAADAARRIERAYNDAFGMTPSHAYRSSPAWMHRVTPG